jgi:hypothetical protein
MALGTQALTWAFLWGQRIAWKASERDLVSDAKLNDDGPAIVSHRSRHAFGSHPSRVVSTSYEQMWCCHGTFGNFWEWMGTGGKKR